MQDSSIQFPGFSILKVVGKGTFGMVYLVKDSNHKLFAIKHVLQDKRYKNREMEITAKLIHSNIVKLEDFFYTTQGNKQYLDLVLEYLPQNLSQKIKYYKAEGKFIPNATVKLYAYQLFQALAYLNKKSVCHRDIKPSNILVGVKDQLKICDFGSAKELVKGEKNIAYICSRYYRAPELIFGATDYTNQVDMWAVGCVIAEMIINKSLFEGDNSTDQLGKIMRLLGTPSSQDLKNMKAKELSMQLPYVQPLSLKKYLSKLNPKVDLQMLELVSRVLVYDPCVRLTPERALDELYFNSISNCY